MAKKESTDTLSDLAPLLRVRPELQDFCRFGGIWSGPHAATGAAQFHIVVRGRCLLERPGHGPIRLGPGDILFLPRGDAHTVRSIAAGAPRPITTEFHNAIRRKSTKGVEIETELVCGVLHFEGAKDNAVVSALPNIIVLRSAAFPLADRLRGLTLGIRDELDVARPGGAAIATDLASALLVMMLREHLEEAPPANGLLALLGQRATAQAVIAMLHEPAREWTLDMLAKASATSRATLVRAFRKTAGIAPLAFLTELRLGLAHQRLATTTDPIAAIAVDVGYQSEAALSRALFRRFGERPGKMRSVRSERSG
jgi:AraC family transcriptional activator of mtrCDE